MQKYIYIHCTNIGESAKPETPTDSATRLQIGGKEVKFLDPQLLNSIHHKVKEEEHWKIQFFRATSYCVEFELEFKEDLTLPPKNFKYSNKALIKSIKNVNAIEDCNWKEISQQFTQIHLG